MTNAASNIETVARDICARQMASTCTDSEELSAAVDRYWHCVAAQLEAGEIDETGSALVPFDIDQSREAYRDWRRRHPSYEVPDINRSIAGD